MRESMSIWFFCGVLFFIYGAIITGQGIWELFQPPALALRPELYSLHAPIWWGAMMGIGGLIATIRHWPHGNR
ncbi:MAG TPA: hypothetical protein VME86_17600 [Acidobacteriaceae bacterium]|nr:hypothetical protein [Acidobacteriaceae bacterium]